MTPPVARGHVEAACAWMIAFARMVEGVGSPEFQFYRQHDRPRIDSPASESLAPVTLRSLNLSETSGPASQNTCRGRAQGNSITRYVAVANTVKRAERANVCPCPRL